MSNFTAIDFETANGERSSICQIGLVIVEQCKIVERIKYYVKPPENKYSQRCIDIHGIKPDDTMHARNYAELYPDIKKYLDGSKVVAHNAAFEISCIDKVHSLYGIAMPKVQWYCTRKIYNLSLADACKKYGINYTAHDAQSDAEAAALLMIKDIMR
jgi:DNA polymerase-3 subunit epsilon